jgi:hypothetical protein
MATAEREREREGERERERASEGGGGGVERHRPEEGRETGETRRAEVGCFSVAMGPWAIG